MRILIVDDHELIRKGVRSLLQSRPDFEICGDGVDGQDALTQAGQLRPELIVMDISMPKMNGLEATREIRRILPQIDVLVLSQHNSPEMMRQALNAGARGYVVKSAISSDLITAIDTVRSGQLFCDTAVSRSVDAHVDVQEILQRSGAFERALGESEERFRLTFEQAAVGMAHVAADGHWLRVNQKLCKIVGYTQEELMALRFQDITHPADLEADQRQADKVAVGELDEYSMGKRFIHKEGHVVWVNLTVSAMRDAERKLRYFVSVVEEIGERKEAEHKLWQTKLELQNTARHLELVTSKMTAPVARCSRDFRFLWANQCYADWIQRPLGEIIGQPIEQVIGRKAFATLLPHYQTALSGERASYEGEVEFDRIGRRWISGAYTPITDPAGYPVGWVTVVVDLTERNRMEEILRESERRYREMIDVLPTAIYTTDAEGRLTHFNPAAVEFAGRVPVLGSDRWCVTWKLYESDGSPLPHEKCPMACLLKDGQKPEPLEVIAERPDGTRRWFTPYPRLLHDANGKVVGGINMLVDITERKRVDQASGLLAAIVDSSDDAIVSKNLDGVITSWNRGAERLFGYKAEEAVGQHITMLIPRKRHREEIAILERLRRGERVDHFETVRVRKDRRLIDVSLSISPVKDSSGRIIGASKVAREITERKRAEKALSEAARQQKALFHLAEELLRTESMEQIYDAALTAILAASGCDRASILLSDESGVMRFVSWRGLSEPYRRAVDGHSAWEAGERNPRPICSSDIERSELSDELKATIRGEGIRALAFIPLVSNGGLIGKFMTYFNQEHEFSEHEVELSLTIARHLAFGIERRRAGEALKRSEDRFRTLAMQLDSEVRVRTEQLEQRNADVLRQSEQLRELSWQLLRTQDAERRRIARELHDSAGQTLAVLGMNLAGIVQSTKKDAAEISEAAEQADQLVQQLTREIRTTSYLLHPPLLDENGLRAALSWYIRGLAERSGLEIDFTVSEQFGRLAEDLELVVFRVVQECLTNIHRHSGSKSATIQIVREAERVLVEVRDRGKGIAPEKLAEIRTKGTGVGIRGMQERVRQFQGEMIIESKGVGTTIVVTFPLCREIDVRLPSHTHAVEPLL